MIKKILRVLEQQRFYRKIIVCTLVYLFPDPVTYGPFLPENSNWFKEYICNIVRIPLTKLANEHLPGHSMGQCIILQASMSQD